MVGLIVLGVCILGAVALICFKGINISYNKHFTVRDERAQNCLTDEQLKTIEHNLNKVDVPKPQQTMENEDSNNPMETVISNIQDLFGPEPNDKSSL